MQGEKKKPGRIAGVEAMLALAGCLGASGDMELLIGRPSIKVPTQRDACEKCGDRIPPGRAGRKCAACRV